MKSSALWLLLPLAVLVSSIQAQEFTSAGEALNAYNHMSECKCDTDKRAFRYFATHADESIPVLIDFVNNNPQRRRVGFRSLSQIKDERVLLFLIDQLDHEQRSNGTTSASDRDYPSEIDGFLIQILGDYGDTRAVPFIERSLDRLNDTHQEQDKVALCKLAAITVSELFGALDESTDRLAEVAFSNAVGNTSFSVKILDWVIDESSDYPEILLKSYVGQLQNMLRLDRPIEALRICKLLSAKFASRVTDYQFEFEKRTYSVDGLIKALNVKAENSTKRL